MSKGYDDLATQLLIRTKTMATTKSIEVITRELSLENYTGANSAYRQAYEAFTAGEISVDKAIELAPLAAVYAFATKGNSSLMTFAEQTPLPKPTEPQPADFEDEDDYDEALESYEESLEAYEDSLEAVRIYVYSDRPNGTDNGYLYIDAEYPDHTENTTDDSSEIYSEIDRLQSLEFSLTGDEAKDLEDEDTRANVLGLYHRLTDDYELPGRLFKTTLKLSGEAMSNLAKLLAQDAEK